MSMPTMVAVGFARARAMASKPVPVPTSRIDAPVGRQRAGEAVEPVGGDPHDLGDRHRESPEALQQRRVDPVPGARAPGVVDEFRRLVQPGSDHADDGLGHQRVGTGGVRVLAE